VLHVQPKRWRGRGPLGEDSGRIATAALANRVLANAVAHHKCMSFVERAADGEAIDYEAAVNGKLELALTDEARAPFASDYSRMVEYGLLLEDAEPFEALIKRCVDVAEWANGAGE
jgi:hypothetical protein